MNAAKTTKFTFDTNFEDLSAAAAQTEARARKAYTAAEIEAIRKAAYDEGRQSGDVRAAHALAASVGQVSAAVAQAIAAMDGEIEAIRSEAAQLAMAAAKRLAHAALAHAPEAEIAEVIHAALHQAIGEPRVVIKTPPDLARTLETHAAEIAALEGFEGRMQFASDPALTGADCRIEWRGAGIERSTAAIEDVLAELIERRFPPRTKE